MVELSVDLMKLKKRSDLGKRKKIRCFENLFQIEMDRLIRAGCSGAPLVRASDDNEKTLIEITYIC
jgi:hypothetical protein